MTHIAQQWMHPARGTYHMTFGCGEVTVADVDAATPMLLLLLLQRMRRADCSAPIATTAPN